MRTHPNKGNNEYYCLPARDAVQFHGYVWTFRNGVPPPPSLQKRSFETSESTVHKHRFQREERGLSPAPPSPASKTGSGVPPSLLSIGYGAFRERWNCQVIRLTTYVHTAPTLKKCVELYLRYTLPRLHSIVRKDKDQLTFTLRSQPTYLCFRMSQGQLLPPPPPPIWYQHPKHSTLDSSFFMSWHFNEWMVHVERKGKSYQ